MLLKQILNKENTLSKFKTPFSIKSPHREQVGDLL